MNLRAKVEQLQADPALIEQLLSDVESLHASVAQSRSTLAQVEEKLSQTQTERDALEAANRGLQQRNEKLTVNLAYLQRIRFGTRTEAMGAQQRELFADDLDADIAAVEQALEDVAPRSRNPRSSTGRQSFPENLQRVEHRHEPQSCQCGQCGGDLRFLRNEITERLDVIPAQFTVHRHIRPQYSCGTCDIVMAAPPPASVIPGGMAEAGLLGWVMVGKYVDHLPLYRLEQAAARSGIVLRRSTLSAWIGRCGEALWPLVDRLATGLRERPVIHADETPVRQLDPGTGKTRQAYLWAYRSNDLDDGPPIVIFDYHGDRKGANARNFLRDWQGHLVVDDYGGYKALFKPDPNPNPNPNPNSNPNPNPNSNPNSLSNPTSAAMQEVGCWAHVWRKFFDLHQLHHNATATEVLQRIAMLYRIEARALRQGYTISQRQQLRRLSLRHLQSFKSWLDDTRLRVAQGSALAKAHDYMLKRWPSLIAYAETGNVPIDNNPVENAIRPIAVGKKNWLFAGSERAGQRAAAIQSLLATAKLNGIEPMAWLTDVLEKLPTWPNSRIDELLPLRR